VLRLTWADFEFSLDVLAAMLPVGTTGLMAIPRGGLILATALSHRTNLPLVPSGYQPPAEKPPAGTVLVDDIADSGLTLALWRKAVGKRAPCLTWCRRASCPQDSLSAITITTNDWVVFPWESQDTAAMVAELEAYRARHK
jgi:hypoxanthine phosphoribosyltransferase